MPYHPTIPLASLRGLLRPLRDLEDERVRLLGAGGEVPASWERRRAEARVDLHHALEAMVRAGEAG